VVVVAIGVYDTVVATDDRLRSTATVRGRRDRYSIPYGRTAPTHGLILILISQLSLRSQISVLSRCLTHSLSVHVYHKIHPLPPAPAPGNDANLTRTRSIRGRRAPVQLQQAAAYIASGKVVSLSRPGAGQTYIDVNNRACRDTETQRWCVYLLPSALTFHLGISEDVLHSGGIQDQPYAAVSSLSTVYLVCSIPAYIYIYIGGHRPPLFVALLSVPCQRSPRRPRRAGAQGAPW
jgi:hypothetical protein